MIFKLYCKALVIKIVWYWDICRYPLYEEYNQDSEVNSYLMTEELIILKTGMKMATNRVGKTLITYKRMK